MKDALNSNAARFAGIALGILFGRFFGFAFFVIAAGFAATLFLFKRKKVNASDYTLMAISLLAGHAIWMSMGLMVPGGLEQVLSDLIIMFGFVGLGFFVARNIWFKSTLIIFEGVCILVNGQALLGATDKQGFLILHLLCRFGVVGLLLAGWNDGKSERSPVPPPTEA